MTLSINGKTYEAGELIAYVKKLEKENAELKEALKNDKVCKCSHYFNFKDLEKQLTKAKDLLKRCYENYIYLEPLRSEIEQFLNSEVEK